MHTSNSPRTIEIAPSSSWASWKLGDVWDYRELLGFLAWRDISVRYKQTLLGLCWAVIQPVVATVAFSLVFGRLAKLPSDGVPYPIFTFAALAIWNFVAAGVARSAASLVGSANLVTKVYFPRLLVPAAAALVGAPDFVVTLVLLAGMMAFYGVVPGAAVLALPLFCLLALITTLGLGLWLSALNARYRDVGHVVPFALQIWLYASPIAYSGHLISSRWRPLYALNPMSGIVEGVRWSLLGVPVEPSSVAVSTVISIAVLISGLCYFKWQERTVADVI